MSVFEYIITGLDIFAFVLSLLASVGCIRSIRYNRRMNRHYRDDYYTGKMVKEIRANLDKDFKSYITTLLILFIAVVGSVVYLWLTLSGRLWG